jgi:hypothetical protein
MFVSLVALAALQGCQFGQPASLKPGPGNGGMEMFTPVKMRLHPLSRMVPPEKDGPANGALVEARLELTDQFGDVTKSPGALYFELYAYQSLVPNHHGDRISLWNFDLSVPQSNKDHWDAITRTYLFKLPVPADALKKEKRAILSATLTLPSGQRLQDDLAISLK